LTYKPPEASLSAKEQAFLHISFRIYLGISTALPEPKGIGYCNDLKIAEPLVAHQVYVGWKGAATATSAILQDSLWKLLLDIHKSRDIG